MRLRKVKNAEEIVNNSNYVIKSKEEIFNNKNKNYLEIGMGKGDFIIQNALLHPDINYIGVEKYASVMVRAIQKLEKLELKNLKLILMDAEEIDIFFNQNIDLLYLNFSDPWPKKRHSMRRLTSPYYLEKYNKIFKNKKHIIQKTDNRHLMEYSIKSFINNGYKIEEICLDLYDENIKDNIPTEYEKKFSAKGCPIYKIEVTKD